MPQLIINGGKDLSGIWRLSGNKNEALPAIVASLLFKNGLTLTNVPEIQDVKVMLEITDKLGVSVERQEKGSYKFINGQETGSELPLDLSSKVRSSLLFLGPLIALTGEATVPRSGGDKIGLRKIDTHLEVFEPFGSTVTEDKITIDRDKYQSGEIVEIRFTEPSVTATESAFMLAALRTGKTIINNAAGEPHVVGIGHLLEKGGVKFLGLGTNRIEIEGVSEMKKTEHRIGEDFMELGGALTLSAIYNGAIQIPIEDISTYNKIFRTFEKFNLKIIHEDKTLKAVQVPPLAEAKLKIISDGPWPNFPSDLMSPLVTLATQTKGQYLFHEKMFESRLYFTDQLRLLGAQLVLCDPHRVVVLGPNKLKGAELVSPDIRAGMALVIAALIATGKSVINNASQIDRGYEDLVGKLKNVGADVEKVEETN